MCHIENIGSECTYNCFWDSTMDRDDSLINSETDGRKELMTPV